MISDEFSNAFFRFSLLRLGAELGGSNSPPPQQVVGIQKPIRAGVNKVLINQVTSVKEHICVCLLTLYLVANVSYPNKEYHNRAAVYAFMTSI